ncbi:MAG: PAS domain-containing sensor histidine kinase [Deltaproteobacteria bacterium]|nr:PAS domain-containing sensor histidine kinase [Deltaproteobacteria bacterium]
MKEEETPWTRIIKKSRDKFRSDFDAIPDGVFSVDRNFNIRSTNKAFAKRIGLSPTAIVSSKCYELGACTKKDCHPDNDGCFANTVFNAGQAEIFVTRSETDAGKPVYFEIHVLPIKGASNHFDHVLVLQRNITQQRNLEKRLEHYNEELQKQVADQTGELKTAYDALHSKKARLEAVNRKLRKLEKLKQDLTNMVIHDLKGPLFEILANLDLLKGAAFSDSEQEYLESAVLGAEEMFRMISNLLDITRMEKRKLTIKKERFNALEAVQESISKVRAISLLKNISVEALVTEDNSPIIEADKHIFGRIMSNLLTNAITYTPEGGWVKIGVSHDKDTNMVRVDVADNGCGVSKEAQKTIFKKFEVAQDFNATSTGLGLTFCRMAVTAHKGKIWLTSTKGKGSTFSFSMPAAGHNNE